MEKKNVDFAIAVMQELGLETTPDGKCYDPETGTVLSYKDKPLKFANENTFVRKGEALFDPLSNPNMMNQLFSYYTTRLNEEDGRYIELYYQDSGSKDSSKGVIKCREGQTIHSSGEFYNDSVKYADLIAELNGDIGKDFSKFDAPIKPKDTKK